MTYRIIPEEIREYCTAGTNSTSIGSYSPSAIVLSMSSMCVTVPATNWNPDAALPLCPSFLIERCPPFADLCTPPSGRPCASGLAK